MDDDYDDLNPFHQLPPEKRRRAIEIKQQIASLVGEYVTVIRADEDPYVTSDDPPFVQAWIVACEWTNMRLEREDKGGRDIIAPEGQTLSNGAGLGQFIVTRYGI